MVFYKRHYGDPLPPTPEKPEEEETNEDIQERGKDGSWQAIRDRLGESGIEYELVEAKEIISEENEELVDEEDADALERRREDEGQDIFIRDPDYVRTHPYTLAARFGTTPSSIQMPQKEFVKPITELLSTAGTTRQLTLAVERVFGGVGLPYSPSTPARSRTMEQQPVALSARQTKMTEAEANAFLVGMYPQAYASITSALVEVRKRLGSEWLRGLLRKTGGPLVLDAGSGGAGVLAWREILKAEWETMQEEEKSPVEDLLEGETDGAKKPAPLGRAVVVTGAEPIRQRASRLLDSTTFIPRLPDLVPKEQPEGKPPRKQYDLILAPYSIWRLTRDAERRYLVQTFWSLLNPNGGILVLLEKGIPRGFEAIADAREHLLKQTGSDKKPNKKEKEKHQKKAKITWEDELVKEPGMIVAPCTNHTTCPLYTESGQAKGRKDWCHFKQRYIRPAYLQSVLGARRRNYDDVEFSYIAVRRGIDVRRDELITGDKATDQAFAGYVESMEDNVEDDKASKAPQKPAPHPLSLPRLILPPLKRKGHIVLDMCTPSGTYERWLVSKKNGKQAYRDARKSKWGDLWALGGKSRELRRIRPGEVPKRNRKNRGRNKREMLSALKEAGIIQEEDDV
ncbi:hypothetical protein BT63DRAFT_365858 [Microthyrium microscopicum]|uniref:Rsm22-domain-containing protein n=1 Tax=Microthyrium microscopicum TaxID=703497 RepID=A0A6A6UUP9_9PEZI|nr:hypothetical protein BT63DRAFT_365858 [Microthyrium microscopicum]